MIFRRTPKEPGGQPSKDRVFGSTCRPHFWVPDEGSKTGYRCAYCTKEGRPRRRKKTAKIQPSPVKAEASKLRPAAGEIDHLSGGEG
jgi:hypothetical protein